MVKQDKNTEEKIIKAAEKVFIEKGMAGARMQEIANEAGINKALLHYYYRSKDKLFSIIFKHAIKTFAPNLLMVFTSEGDFFTKLENFVYTYLTIIEKNPHLPGFILHELSNRPDNLKNILGHLEININPIAEEIQEEMDKGRIRQMNPVHLLVNVISLCIFPVVAKPMILGILFDDNEDEYKELMHERKQHVVEFVINSIKLNDK